MVRSCAELGAEYVQPAHSIGLWDTFAYYTSFEGSDWRRLAWRHRRMLHGLDLNVGSRRPDCMLSLEGCQYAGMIARLMNKRYGIPYIVWERTTYYQRGLVTPATAAGRNFAAVLKAATAILTVSPQLGESIRTAVDLSYDKMFVMPNPVPDIFFQKS